VRALAVRAALRELRAGKVLLLLAVGGVALGVAAVLSVQLLDRSALGAFAGTVKAVSGDADLTVLGWAGGLDERLWPEVLATPGVGWARPLWRAEVAVAGDEAGLEVLGVDFLAASGGPAALGPGQLGEALGTAGWVALSPARAAELQVREGDALVVSLGSRRATLRVGALVDLARLSPLASRRLALMDIGQAQGLLGAPGRIHEVAVKAAPGVAPEALRERLAAILGGRARVVTPEQRTVEAAGLLAAFRLNLTALSAVSVLVGGFLVLASVRASLARRREELGVLRVVGATRGQVLRLVLGEAALLGVAGTAAGIPLGCLAARANLAAVSGTIRNLYLMQGIERLELGPGLVALACAVGAGGAVAGALWPALDASRTDPRALLARITLDEQAARGAGRLLGAGLAFLLATAAAALLAWRLARWPGAGFLAAIGILVAVPLAAPALLALLGRTGRPRRLGVRHGLRTLSGRLAGAAPAAGALAVAVSMVVGITVMVGSFRATVVGWLDATLHADVYVTSPSWRRARGDAVLAPEVVARLGAVPQVRAVDLLRQQVAEAGGRRLLVSGLDARLAGGEGRVALLEGEGRAAMGALARGAALVSEPLARRAGLHAGGTLALRGADGGAALPVAGVYRDYGAEGGAVLVDLSTVARLYGPGQPSNAALYLEPGADPEAAVAAVRAALPGAALQVRSNATLRREVLRIFEQTFAVTRLLRTMGLLIAAAGVALALLVMARERRAELALYRALGAGRGQLFRLFLGRGLGLGLAGLALGAAGGAALAAVLIEAVNPAYFGWGLETHVPWGALAGEALAILCAAAAASLYPALAASRTPAQELSRDAV
jgi:putative ABC transport system permease protein